jgi:hypothetical protein
MHFENIEHALVKRGLGHFLTLKDGALISKQMPIGKATK